MKLYSYLKTGNTYILSIANHADLVEALTQFIKDEAICLGQISGLGATNSATLRFYDPNTKQYIDRTFSEQMEIANLTGNISTLDSEPYLHLHVTLGRADYTALAGHLLTANISGACELFVEKYDSTINRTKDPETGLNMYHF